MELKNIILESLDTVIQEENTTQNLKDIPESKPKKQTIARPISMPTPKIKTGKVISPDNVKVLFNPQDVEFIENLKEKLLVLFEGLKITQNQDDKRRIDLIINFLQYELCLIEEFLEQKNNFFNQDSKT